jgi:hypothetical protein
MMRPGDPSSGREDTRDASFDGRLLPGGARDDARACGPIDPGGAAIYGNTVRCVRATVECERCWYGSGQPTTTRGVYSNRTCLDDPTLHALCLEPWTLVSTALQQHQDQVSSTGTAMVLHAADRRLLG